MWLCKKISQIRVYTKTYSFHCYSFIRQFYMYDQRPTDYFFPSLQIFIDDSLLFIVLLAKNELNFDFTETAVLAAKEKRQCSKEQSLMLLCYTLLCFCFCKEHQKLCWPSVLNICPRGKLAFVNTLGSFYFYTFFPVVGGGAIWKRRECVSWSISTLLEHKSNYLSWQEWYSIEVMVGKRGDK